MQSQLCIAGQMHPIYGPPLGEDAAMVQRYQDEMMERRIQANMPESMILDIDDWRRRQPDVPNRSEAIRRLVEIGLRAK